MENKKNKFTDEELLKESVFEDSTETEQENEEDDENQNDEDTPEEGYSMAGIIELWHKHRRAERARYEAKQEALRKKQQEENTQDNKTTEESKTVEEKEQQESVKQETPKKEKSKQAKQQSKKESKEENPEDNKKEKEEFLEKIRDLESKILKLEAQHKIAEFEFKNKIQKLEAKSSERVEEIKKELYEKAKEEKENIKKFSLQKFLESFISPFSNLKSAIDFGVSTENPAVSNYVKGFEMLYKQLENVLESFGVQKIEPKKGEPFDSHFHSVYQVEDVSNNETIIEIKSIGYKLHDRVIKPALVIVGKK